MSKPGYMTALKVKSTAVLIGYDPKGTCVYSEILDLSDYYDGEHVWDRASSVKSLRLSKVKGYLFGADGVLDQEFESVFNLRTGVFKSGHARFADGTVRNDP